MQAANKLCRLASMCKYNTQGSYSYNHCSGQKGSTIDRARVQGLVLRPTPYTYITYIAFLVSSIRAACPAHLILRDLIILIMFDEEYKL
jgi:hypothetical protein